MALSISAQEAVALAKSGNADAQYALSRELHGREQFDASLYWLRQAAAQQLIPAQMTLAILLMEGRHCARDTRGALELLEPLAATHIQANLLLSELHGFAAFGIDDRETGLRYLLAAGRLGEADALRQLALLCVSHQRWDLVEALGGVPGPAAGQRAPGVNGSALEEALSDLATDIPLPTAEILNTAPLVRRLPGVIQPPVLDWLINMAAPLVQRSRIVDARTGETRADPMRTSCHLSLGPRRHDHVLEALERCMSRVTGLPPMNGEFLQVLRYRAGEQYRLHVDYFNESGAGAHQALAAGGQRAQTVLTYLTDGYTGGATCFPKLRLDIRARRGDMLHFHNLNSDGLGHRDSLHAGLPVMTGEKWVLSQWIRSAAYPPRVNW